MVAAGGEFGQVFAEVVVEDCADRVGLVAVHVNQSAEVLLGALEQPVDGTLLVELDVVGVEILEEIFANGLANFAGQVVGIKGVFQKREILFVVLSAKGDFEKLFEASGDIVFEPIAIDDGNNVVFIGEERVVSGEWADKW